MWTRIRPLIYCLLFFVGCANREHSSDVNVIDRSWTKQLTEELANDSRRWAYCFRAEISEDFFQVYEETVGETPSCLVRFVVSPDGSTSEQEVVEQIVFSSRHHTAGNYRVRGLSDVGTCLLGYLEKQRFISRPKTPSKMEYRFRPEVACQDCEVAD